MCGIFGVVLKSNCSMSLKKLSDLLNRLYTLSESRGSESSGLHAYLPKNGKSWTLKGATSASALLKSTNYKTIINKNLQEAYSNSQDKTQTPLILLAHSRLVTNGSALINLNNQPVQFGKTTVIHNGIVVNVDDLWQEHLDLERVSEVDTEIIAAMLNNSLEKTFDSITATNYVFEKIKGAASIAWANDESTTVTLATNTGDLYYFILPDDEGIVFASEHYILKQALTKLNEQLPSIDLNSAIQNLEAGSGLVFNTSGNDKALIFQLNADNTFQNLNQRLIRKIQNQLIFTEKKHQVISNKTPKSVDYSLLKYNESAVKALRRCSRCILPETFPFIQFDNNDICNYCNHYKPHYNGMHRDHTKQAFITSLEKYRRNTKNPDVLVPFSGGRDSSFGLHLICKEFNLKPVTFTYDWGMVTDLARRNIARMCGQLGVQNILVSADINQKRKNIRNNVAAWLKKPDLGMVPLFMAGDKSFFKIVNQLKRQTKISLNLWCANPLENTDFKSGFCGINPNFDKARLDYLSLANKLKLLQYYSTRFITNPGYINSSLVDTFKAFLAYYVEPRQDFYFIFDHFIWDENEVNHTLLQEYDWETSPESKSTWRIGDGTAPFYNYIYNTAHGFSEFDTFRSNQIREGVITRECALNLILEENRPREESLRWYLDTIGLDFNSVIKKINQLDIRGLHQ